MIYNTILLFLLSIFGYLIGSMCSAVYICWIWGLPDPRDCGSRNPGATNVKRLGGSLPAFLTLLFDALKGLLPVLFAKQFLDNNFASIIWISVVVGHCFSIFLGFRGGKGIATGLGGLFGLDWFVASIAFTVWILVIILTKVSALGGLAAFVVIPLLLFYLQGYYIGAASLLISILIFWRHKSNIFKLFNLFPQDPS